jgi:alpha-beta hydrolase superfamily lysophospholipase
MTLSKKILLRLVWMSLTVCVIAVVLAILAVVTGWSQFAKMLPQLDPWHRDFPVSEFTVRDEADGYTFTDYLAQEDKVFGELDAMISGAWKGNDSGKFSRFNPGSVSFPGHAGSRNWNRSALLEAPEPRGGVLMIHGLSDSPYSFRSLSDRLHRDGYTVMRLRVPGHGTCPGALAKTDWRDWAAAVRIAARDLRKRLPEGSPLIIAGYSNGGALTVNYAIESIEDPSLPVPDALVLISPMIGITPLAEITRFHKPIAALSGEERAHWSAVNAEIDPYKYTSWPMNASVQAFRMTGEVEVGLARLAKSGRMAEFPPLITHISAIDATVKISNLLDSLYDRLEGEGNELVVYDVNRHAWMESLLKDDYEKAFRSLIEEPPGNFDTILVTNRGSGTRNLSEIKCGRHERSERELDLSWPEGLFSLAHAALPFPPDDPFYGSNENGDAPLPLGALSLRGESGVLRISDGQILRLRHNPFYQHMEDRIATWLAER